MLNCAFVYYPEASHIDEVLTVLNNLNLDVWEIKTNPELVSNLIPNTLKGDAESWLIFFTSNKPQEALILPFPDPEKELSLRGYLADLIPILRQYFQYDSFRIPPSWIGRFEYLQTNVPFHSLLEGIFADSARQQLIDISQGASQNIQQQRNEILSRALWEESFGILDGLDKVFVRENNRIFRYLQGRYKFVEVVPPIVNHFKDIMDPETKRFLISSETVKQFAYDHSLPNFDYSAPGCGLWKAVERELNLSLILHLRRARGIASLDQPWVGIRGQNPSKIESGGGHSVNLNKRELEDSSKLEGIMLGPMMYILKAGNWNRVHEALGELSLNNSMLSYLLGPGANSLPEHLQELLILRNGHAHTSAMSLEKFKTLRDLVLPQDTQPDTCLVKILQLKREVFKV